ncbi:GH1 family beta-glucosidase [Ferroacidibacillus organovorans]|uniref:Beta-glucosidase n=1 Tax=Ferroacidibacillus organovorans TaxID=1765683 RepID=A0A117SXL6_9BACL|nr:GH1 family beta-glucosidase [Ferroacidibacillus organovorans]KUO95523.1 beta-glucosidase [Ferroacidibacillus organovorans]
MRTNFPKDFVWGVATSSYQIEGGVNEGGRGSTIWDDFCAMSDAIVDNSDGAVACDHYHRYREDFALMRSMGIKHYRLSLAWSRLFPNGDGEINRDGIDFYNSLLDALEESGIEPMVTLYHWDLPSALQERGGWASRETVYAFERYAKAVFEHFGHRVKMFITHNEPWCTAFLGHGIGIHAPGIRDHAQMLDVAHHLMLSHGLAVQAFRAMGCAGQIGITLNLSQVYSETERPVDILAAERIGVFHNGWFLDPILLGRYSDLFGEVFGQMPAVMQEGDLDVIAQPIDFLGINYYSYRVVVHDENSVQFNARDVTPHDRVTDMDWPILGSGLRDLLLDLHKTYGNVPLYITENGCAQVDCLEGGRVHDPLRIDYFREHLAAISEALYQGVPLRGYYAWTFMDNFEWSYGYTKTFGLVYVDRTTQERIPKDSAFWYADFIRSFDF